MKILSLTQPWATLMDIDAKKFETRSWATPYRGPIAIHAAKNLTPVGGRRGLNELCSREPFRSVLLDHYRVAHKEEHLELFFLDFHLWLPFGEILCVGELVQCYNTLNRTFWDKRLLSEQEREFGDYSPNRQAWQFENIKSLIPTLRYTGAQGLRDLPVKDEADILKRLT